MNYIGTVHRKMKKYLLSRLYSVPPKEPECVRVEATSTTLKVSWERGEETSEYNYCDYYQLEIEPQRKEIKEALELCRGCQYTKGRRGAFSSKSYNRTCGSTCE